MSDRLSGLREIVQKKRKYPVSLSYEDGNTLLISEENDQIGLNR